VSLGAGGAYIATAATSAGSSNFVPIAPCRLADTRATSTVGTRSTPVASTNNWVAGAPPTPNKVDVNLSATGSISAFNNVGTVNLVIDVVGYYEPSGVPGYEVVTKNVTIPADGFLGDSLACPAGKRPLSGNYFLTSAPTFGALRLVQSQIGPTTWGMVIENVGGASVAVTATLQVVCATA
jgi:hypothetical protein